ncbi:type II toxin-antitoxin system RelE/ParE family toxin [Pseudomonas sp. MYb118]|uniref:type II toxin-antitoxin system RelE/ParE family toxin n=1 Tax=Pseudomonas sp. MYb118 TaxID=1848720 RepID=UPI0034CE6AF3
MRPRLFKTKRFAVQAGKAWIGDDELRDAFAEMLKGQAESLGGGVWKKRLNANRHRSIVVAKGGSYWIYQVLFAKKDRSNISAEELSDLRVLAKAYSAMTENDVQHLLDAKEFVEIAHEQKIQK